MEKKILVAVDGSIYSLNAVRYLSRLFTNLTDVSLHLISIIPATASTIGREWMEEEDLLTSMGTAAGKQYNLAKRHVNEALLHLARGGVNPEQVTTSVRISRMGIAADILNEAKKGMYDALLVGRRGITKLQELVIGSVSSTILEKCHDIPIWIIDGRVDSRKFLVPVDGTVYALKAVDHLGHIIRDNPYAEVTLFYSSAMLAHKRPSDPADFHEHWDREWCELYLGKPDSLFSAPEQILLENGLPKERIHRLKTEIGLYPSRQIVRQALIDDFGTIVIGRRGVDVKKGIFKRVSNQVVFMAEDVAIWVVG